MRKIFPIPMYIVQLDGKCVVWINKDFSVRQFRNISITMTNLTTGKKEKQIVSSKKPFAEYFGLKYGEQYQVQSCFNDIMCRFIYKPHNVNIQINQPAKYLRVFGVGSGRSGTTSLATYLDGMTFQDGTPLQARHESAAHPIMFGILHKRLDLVQEIVASFSHNVEVAPYYWLIPDVLKMAEKVLFIVRDGRAVVSSGMNRGWYARNTIWDKVKPPYQGTLFQKCCELWVNSCKTLMPISDVTIRLEDIRNSLESRKILLDKLQIIQDDRDFPKKNIGCPPAVQFVWTDKHYELFHKYCGKYMEHFYPGWQRCLIS